MDVLPALLLGVIIVSDGLDGLFVLEQAQVDVQMCERELDLVSLLSLKPRDTTFLRSRCAGFLEESSCSLQTVSLFCSLDSGTTLSSCFDC